MKKIILLLVFSTLVISCSESEKDKSPEEIQTGENIENTSNTKNTSMLEDNTKFEKKDIRGSEISDDLNKPNSERDKVSYSMGYYDGKRIGEDTTFNVNMDYYLKGLADGLIKDNPYMPYEEIENTLRDFAQKQMKKYQETMQKLKAAEDNQQLSKNPALKKEADKNKKIAENFLKENMKKPGVKTTQSGLQYKVIKEGKGSHPDMMSAVSMNMVASLPDGTILDDTKKSGQPLNMRVEQLVPGWAEAIQLMKPGAIYEVYLPPHIGFGPLGVEGRIPPNALVILELELLELRKPKGNE